MIVSTSELLNHARRGKFSIGAFNVYNLEEVRGVIEAAESLASPVILQILPNALAMSGEPLIKICLEAGRWSSVPVSVHLDHCSSSDVIGRALAGGMSSVMADGSHLAYGENIRFTRDMVRLAGLYNAMVEAELGRLTGTEDGLTVAEYEEQLTDPEQAVDFVTHTGVAALAVCIGNVHGKYTREPELDFDRLEAIAERLTLPIVLHGTSGLPDEMIRRSISLGVCKFNVNTELRQAYISSAGQYLGEAESPELVDLMHAVIDAVKDQVASKLELFGSVNKTKA